MSRLQIYMALLSTSQCVATCVAIGCSCLPNRKAKISMPHCVSLPWNWTRHLERTQAFLGYKRKSGAFRISCAPCGNDLVCIQCTFLMDLNLSNRGHSSVSFIFLPSAAFLFPSICFLSFPYGRCYSSFHFLYSSIKFHSFYLSALLVFPLF